MSREPHSSSTPPNTTTQAKSENGLGWLSDVTAGLVVGVLGVAVTISLAVLVYANSFGAWLPEAIGLALLSTILLGLVVAVASSLPGMFAQIQDAPAAILAVAAAGLVASFPSGADARDAFVTVVVANALTTVVCGIALLALGAFRLGRLVRYLPYPVVGGFLAGTGWLLLLGGIGVMSGTGIDLARLHELFGADVWPRWLPGVALAVVFLAATRRLRHFLVWPALLVASVAGFFVVMAVGGGSAAAWREAGLLLGSFQEGSLLRVFDYSELGRVSWPAVAGHAATTATVAFIATMGVLFNSSGLELATRRRLDLNRELIAAGAGNLLAGLGGGLVGYQILSFTALNFQIGTGKRLASLVAVATIVLVVAFGAPLLAWVPMTIVGALLVFLGLAFLQEWIVDAYAKLAKLEYAVVLLILAVIATFGFLQGVAVGLFVALILFVVSYSRTEVVRHALSGATYRSRVARTASEDRRLDELGHRLFVLELQGYVFFGTANKLLNQVLQRLDEQPPAEFMLIDVRHVTGLDATALMGFEQIAQVTQQRGARLVIASARPRFRAQLERSGLLGDEAHGVAAFDDLDTALEWCEDRLLDAPDRSSEAFVVRLARMLREPDQAPQIAGYFERVTLAPEDVLMREGDPADALYFVESGRVSARLEREGSDGIPGQSVRLESMRGGGMVGELGFFTGGARSASVVADEETVVHRLTRDGMQRMRTHAPALATDFQELALRLLSERVRHLVDVVEALRR